MKKNQFPLASVLDLKASAKAKAEDVLAAAIRDCCAAERNCIEARRILAVMAECLVSIRFTADMRTSGLRAVAVQEQSCSKLDENLVAATELVNRQRGELVLAHQDHEAILKLKGRWDAAAQREESRRQEIELNDFVNARFSAKANSQKQ